MSTIQKSEVLGQVVCFDVQASIWSARKKLKPEDLGLDVSTMPPSELASLGSKKIFDHTHLNVFHKLKKRAERALEDVGVRFMGGYAVPFDLAESRAKELDKITDLFNEEKKKFLNNYDSELNLFLSKYPQWSQNIRKAIISSAEVANRISIGWVAFQASPVDAPEDSPLASSLGNQSKGLKDRLYDEIAEDARKLLELTTLRGHAHQKTLRPLKAMRKKMAGLQFLDPTVQKTIGMIDSVLAKMPGFGLIEDDLLAAFMGLLSILSNPERVKAMGKKMIESGMEPAELLEVEMRPEESEVETADQNTDPAAVVFVPVLMPTMPSMPTLPSQAVTAAPLVNETLFANPVQQLSFPSLPSTVVNIQQSAINLPTEPSSPKKIYSI